MLHGHQLEGEITARELISPTSHGRHAAQAGARPSEEAALPPSAAGE